MKLCDRCFEMGEHKPGPHMVSIAVEEFDLCESCKEIVRQMIINPGKPNAEPAEKPKRAKRRPGRKPKTAGEEKP